MSDDDYMAWRMRKTRRRARVIAVFLALALLVPIVISTADAVGG